MGTFVVPVDGNFWGPSWLSLIAGPTCLLPLASCLLPPASCLLPPASCLLPLKHLAAVYLMDMFLVPVDGSMFGAEVSGANCSCRAFISVWEFSYFKPCPATNFMCQREWAGCWLLAGWLTS